MIRIKCSKHLRIGIGNRNNGLGLGAGINKVIANYNPIISS